MNKEREIGKITLQIDSKQLERIIQTGRMEAFIEAATTLFNRDLKAELVQESVSSVGTALFQLDNDEFGTWPPRPPHWWNIGRIDAITKRLDSIEKVIGLQSKDLRGSGAALMKSEEF